VRPLPVAAAPTTKNKRRFRIRKALEFEDVRL
jgi:hypothetical protein